MSTPGEVKALTVQGRGSPELLGRLTPFLALVGACLFAAGTPPVPDYGYQFYLAGRVMDGARLFADVGAAEGHPPLITWMCVGIESVGRLIGVPGLTLLPFFICLLAAGAIYAAWRLGVRSGFVLVVLVGVLIAIAGPSFGQGEHLALLLALPYLVASARSAGGEAPLAPAARWGIALTAALGLALKPHFALIWLGVEGYLAAVRGLRSLRRLECLVILGVFVLYVLATALITPEYFRILRWVLPLYGRFATVPLRFLLLDRRTLVFLAGIAAALIARRRADDRRLADIVAIAAGAMYLALLSERKGFGYHWYPVVALSAVLVAIALAPSIRRLALLVPVLALGVVYWTDHEVSRTAELLTRQPTYLPRMVAVTQRYARGGSILVLSHSIGAGFPLVNVTGVHWVSPYGALWMIPAIYADSAGARGDWRWLERQMFDRLWVETVKQDPAITVLQKNFASYFASDPRFRSRFARSPVLDTVGYYYILGRPRPPASGADSAATPHS